MSSGVTLSSATRANLLALQNTADLVSTTQNRLSTGKKVNSAIDNASNYFTASGLSSRSSALSTLLDGISNGIQTIQAANQGITSIQKLTAQLKSTAQQALASSNSFTSKASSSASLTGAVAGNLLSTGGTVATANNALSANSSATAAAQVGSGDYAASASGSKTGTTYGTVPVGGATLALTGHTGTDSVTIAAGDSITTAVTKINAKTSTTGVTAAEGTGTDAGKLVLTDASGNFTYTASDASLGLGTSAATTTNYVASGRSITINGTAISIGNTATLTDTINAINAQSATTGVTASVDSSTKLKLTGPTDGSSYTVQASANSGLGFLASATTISGTFSPTGASLARSIGFAANDTFTVNGATVAVGATDTLDSLAAKVSTATNGAVSASYNATTRKFVFTAADGATGINLGNGSTGTAQVSNLGFITTSYAAGRGSTGALNGLNGTNLTVKVGAGATAIQTTLSFGTGANQVSTLDQLNAALGAANAQATIDANGKLTITTANEAGAEDLTLSGTATSSVLTGTSSSAVIGGDGSTTRNKLVSDYNTLLNQIDQLSADAGFNGVNLLAGDTVKVIFNEKNTSSVSIKGIATTSDSLDLKALGSTDFQDATKINAVLDQITSANTTLESQAATYGTNLSVVQNRQDFSKGLINILDTGAANLTDADLNEEAANSQALTTRQSLGISALSLANQAQQGILQLLR